MEKIRQLDDKILQLKQRKEQAEIKLARALLKKVRMTLGKDADVGLATLILQETWDSAREENKEVWRSKADTFRSSRVTRQTKSAEIGGTKLTEVTKAGKTNFTRIGDTRFTQLGESKPTEVTKAI